MNSNGPLFEESINLTAYPPEYIFSEKFESILYLGQLNSRMKDYYDCYRLIKENALNGDLLKEAVSETMSNRGTQLEFIPESVDAFDAMWKAFLKKNKIGDLDLNEVVSEINSIIKEM